jgi:Protein of unknown function (DUF3071)
MRALRVLGLANDDTGAGDSLLLEHAESGERFTVPADERLRAAARGDLSRLGQLELDLEPQLRPREIQARIRAGASLADVAAAANTSANRIERYAYPVLLERSSMADRARQAHPLIDGNPSRRSLDELVMAVLAERGQDSRVSWDAYRDESGWVLALRWHAGRSENRAHWAIHSGPRTNTLRPKDEAARDILDTTRRPLRTIDDAEGTAQMAPVPPAAAPPDPAPADEIAAAVDEVAARHPAGSRRPPEAGGPAADAGLDETELVEGTVTDERAGVRPPAQAAPAVRTGTDHAPSRTRRGQRPVMPGWEDVLLGGSTPGAGR